MTILSNLPPPPPAREAESDPRRRTAIAAGIGSAALVAALLYCRGERDSKGGRKRRQRDGG